MDITANLRSIFRDNNSSLPAFYIYGLFPTISKVQIDEALTELQRQGFIVNDSYGARRLFKKKQENISTYNYDFPQREIYIAPTP